jgi:hypothetical protein
VPDEEDGEIRGESARLQDQRSLDQDLAHLVFSGTVRSVHGFCCTIADQDFDEQVDADECCKDTSWVERRQPGDVVECSSQDEVSCAGVNGPSMDVRMLEVRWTIAVLTYGPDINKTMLAIKMPRSSTLNAPTSLVMKPIVMSRAPQGMNMVTLHDL